MRRLEADIEVTPSAALTPVCTWTLTGCRVMLSPPTSALAPAPTPALASADAADILAGQRPVLHHARREHAPHHVGLAGDADIEAELAD